MFRLYLLAPGENSLSITGSFRSEASRGALSLKKRKKKCHRENFPSQQEEMQTHAACENRAAPGAAQYVTGTDPGASSHSMQRSKVTSRLGSLSASTSSEESPHNGGLFVATSRPCQRRQTSLVTWQKKAAGDPAVVLRNIAQCLSLFDPHRWYKSKPLGEVLQRETQQREAERLARGDILHPSDAPPPIHHNENLHLRLVNHKRPSARATVRKQTKQRWRSASSRHIPTLFAAFPNKKLECLFVCLCLHSLDNA